MKTKLFLWLGLISLSSCNVHKATLKNLKGKDGNYQMSYDAVRRGSLMSVVGGKIDKILSEVQPDAVISQTLDITGKLSGKLKDDKSLTAEQITKITESLTTLGERTAAVNMLRDALYRLEEHCINFPNSCDGDKYFIRYDLLVKTITELQKEITNQKKEQVKEAEEKTKQMQSQVELLSFSEDMDAKSNYQLVIKNMLSKNFSETKSGLNYLYKKYPTYFNIEEINNKILEFSKKELSNEEWKEIYKFIVDGHLWGISNSLQSELKEKSK